MKIPSKWSILGYVSGGIFAFGSFWRYFILYPDVDKVISYVIIGILVCAVSWLYNRQLQMSHTLDAVENKISDIVDGMEQGEVQA